MTTHEEDCTKSVHIHRVMPELGNRKWRVMYESSGFHWMTLDSKGIKLLVECGCKVERAFTAADLVFDAPDRPLVQIVEERGKSKLCAVWNGVRFVSVHEGEKSVTEEKTMTPAVNPNQPQEGTIEYVNLQVNSAVARRKSERDQQRLKDGNPTATMTAEEQQRESAEIYTEVLVRADQMEDNIGKVKLLTLWRMRNEGVFRLLPNAPEGVAAAIRPLQLQNRDYTLSLAKVVDTIFAEVQAMSKAGQPFLNSDGNVEITVEKLIMGEGLVRKLTKSAEHWSKLVSVDDKRKLLDMIMNGTTAEVQALRDSQSKVTKTEDRIEAKIAPVAERPGYSTITLLVDEAQELAVMRLLKPLIGELKQ